MSLDDELAFIKSSYSSIKRELKLAGLNQNHDEQVLHLVRLSRLQQKIEQQTSESMLSNKRNASEYVSIMGEIDGQLSKWYARFAEQYESDGNNEAALISWIVAIGYGRNAKHLFCFAQHILKNTGLMVHRDIKENMELINPHNIHELIPKLKTVRMCIQAAVKEDTHTEETRHILTFLDLIEKEIGKRDDLQEALNQEEVKISIEAALSELNQLIGMSTVKTKIREISNWILFSQLRRDQGLKTEKLTYHMIFSGNPGTGKTTVARIIARIYQALGVLKKGHLVEVGRSDLVAEYVGQTATKTMAKIKEAENGVLFVDEAYSLTRSGGNDFGIEAIDTLVKAMEDKRDKLVVILAGYPAEMEQFVKSNPGLYSRFKYHVDFPDYTSDELLHILQLMLHTKQYRMDEEALSLTERMIKKVMIRKPNEHGNGRLVRNLIEDAILKKATVTIEQQEKENKVVGLDLIDGDIMKLVEADQNRYK